MRALGENVLFVQFAVLLALIIIDVVAAVALGIKTGKFDWGKLLTFLRTNVACYVIVWGVLAGAAWLARWAGIEDETLTSILVFVNIIYALVVGRLAASIFANLKKLGVTGGSED